MMRANVTIEELVDVNTTLSRKTRSRLSNNDVVVVAGVVNVFPSIDEDALAQVDNNQYSLPINKHVRVEQGRRRL